MYSIVEPEPVVGAALASIGASCITSYEVAKRLSGGPSRREAAAVRLARGEAGGLGRFPGDGSSVARGQVPLWSFGPTALMASEEVRFGAETSIEVLNAAHESIVTRRTPRGHPTCSARSQANRECARIHPLRAAAGVNLGDSAPHPRATRALGEAEIVGNARGSPSRGSSALPSDAPRGSRA